MKKALCAAFFLVFLAEQALAAWTDDFVSDFDRFGLDLAVENALSNDVKPDDILTFVLQNRSKFNSKMSMKALYCAGVSQDAVREAAAKLGIADLEISKALEESIQECGSKVALTDRDIMEVPGPKDTAGVSGTPPAPAPVSGPTKTAAGNNGQQQGGGANTAEERSDTPPVLPPPITPPTPSPSRP